MDPELTDNVPETVGSSEEQQVKGQPGVSSWRQGNHLLQNVLVLSVHWGRNPCVRFQMFQEAQSLGKKKKKKTRKQTAEKSLLEGYFLRERCVHGIINLISIAPSINRQSRCH